MTKRVMTKKFMKETGADKKTAMDYLRKCNWNYGQAKLLYNLPETLSNFTNAMKEIDWTSIFATVTKAVEECTKALSEALQSIDWKEAVKKIQEERGESNEDTN
jgi:hypothetical protein